MMTKRGKCHLDGNGQQHFTENEMNNNDAQEKGCTSIRQGLIRSKIQKKSVNSTTSNYAHEFNSQSLIRTTGVSSLYLDLGNCDQVCKFCGATFWFEERLKHSAVADPCYKKCCNGGKVILPATPEPPEYIKELFKNRHFMDNIRAYNMMFSMTSFGADIDRSVNNGAGPYVFKIYGQIYHSMGALCPDKGDPPRFLQLYIYDTQHEVHNRMKPFGGEDSGGLRTEIVSGLINTLDEHNELIKLFRTARDKCGDEEIPDFQIRLFNDIPNSQYQLPTSDVIGAIVFEPGPRSEHDHDIVIQFRGGRPQRINKLHPLYMPLQFPLLFIYGQPGYSTDMKLSNLYGDGPSRMRRLTMNMYYSFQLHDRFNLYALLLRGGRLFQQYVVNAYVSIEQNRLDYIKQKQNDIRNEYLRGIHDAISRGDHDGSDVGTRTILPASFTGSPRYMYKHYQDALAICRVHGNPMFFITFTCNVKWPEVDRYMKKFPELKIEDRPDILDRIFEMKVQQFVKFLKNKKPFGDVAAVLYTIEFQKRGLPHCHTLLWLTSFRTVESSEEIDNFISAELPDENVDPKGYKVVSEFMMHGPCGLAKPDSPCMKDNACSKYFPKRFHQATSFDNDGYIEYRRRDTGICAVKNGINLDNSYVVPYNRLLCLAFQAHINVEFCGKSMLIKYLFKYISKGTDRVKARVIRAIGDATTSGSNQQMQINEIKDYIDGRFICPHEACWRILAFDIHMRDPAVQVLSVHLPEMQQLTFRATEILQSIINDPFKKRTTLTQWLAFNKVNDAGHHLTYLDFPLEFVWYPQSKEWAERYNKNKPSIGRLAYIHPSCGDVFYLRMLLSHKKGSTSFEDLRTVNDKVFPTYRSTCEALGLLGDDREWEIALEEACVWATASELRSLFVHILVFCDLTDPISLWRRQWNKMADDIPLRISRTLNIQNYHVNNEELEGYVLYEIEATLNSHSKSLIDYGLPMPPPHLLAELRNKLLMEEKNYDRVSLSTEQETLVAKLNVAQQNVYNAIINASKNGTQTLIFVYGHGGTGKTFLWRAIITTLRAQGKIVLAVASSGIASLLLPSGRTAHSRFKLPLDLSDETVCRVKKGTQLANLLIETTLIIWDEAPMNDRKCFETLDRSLRDILDAPDTLFGGKSIMLGGDFRQTLPVKPRGSKLDIIGSSISESELWHHFKVCRLTENMRLLQPGLTESQKAEVAEFSSWLLDVGDGRIGVPDESNPDDIAWVQIPDKFLIHNDENGISELVKFIYDEGTLQAPTAERLQDRAIVCPKNDTADMINKQVLSLLPGEATTYMSLDSVSPLGNDGGEAEVLYPPEYLNTLHFKGMPHHLLELKVGTPIMLLRNLNLVAGLCNGTRMIVTQLLRKVIEAKVITGTRIGEKVFLPRISLIHKDPKLPFTFKRRQFPVKVCYAMTINKSQGQSLNRIGVYLPDPIFGHGQLYVALSRATSPGGLKILINHQENQRPGSTKNIVYADFLRRIKGTQSSHIHQEHNEEGC